MPSDESNPSASEALLVHLVDDDPLVRAYTAEILAGRNFRAQEHVSGSAFLDGIATFEPGCVLLDIEMPGLNGIQVLDALIARELVWPVVVLTARNDIRTAVEAMKRGAIEFLNKPFTPDELFAVLEAASEQLARASEEAARIQHARERVAALSARETEVLRGMLAGLANKVIAFELKLSVRTVEIYRGNVMDKLQVRSLSAALRLALAAGLEPLVETA